MRACAGTESQEPRERAQRDVAKDEDHGHGRGRRALMLCGGLCAVARARARAARRRSHVASHWWYAPRPSVRRAASCQFLRVFFASKLVNTNEN